MRREIPGPKSFISYQHFKQNGNCDNPGFLHVGVWVCVGVGVGVGVDVGVGGRLHIIFLTNFIL